MTAPRPRDPAEGTGSRRGRVVRSAEGRGVGGARRESAASLALVIAGPALLALVLGIQRSAVMPLWRDEFATRLYASLSPADLFRATTHVDAVLAPYYLLMHALTGATGLGTGMRIPSLVAFAVAAAGVALLALCWFGIGWSGTVGALVAGTVLATNGVLLGQAANARPYALATMFVVLAVLGLELVRRGRPWAGGVGFAVCAAAAVTMQPLSAAMLLATVALAAVLGHRGALLWLGASVPWVAIAGMMLWAGRGQTGQLAWVAVPTVDAVIHILATLGGVPSEVSARVAVAAVVGLLGLGALALVALRGARTIVAFALLAAFVPTLALFAVSVTVHPVLDSRYVVWSCAGVALLLGAAAAGMVSAFRRRNTADSARLVPAMPLRAGGGWSALGGAVAGAVIAALVATSLNATAAAIADPPPRKDDFPAAVARIDRDARLGDLVVVVQRYEQGGVALGVALSAGDTAYAREIERDAPRGTRTVLDVRRVVGRDPLRTVPEHALPDGSGSADPSSDATSGRTFWIVSIWPPEIEDPTVLGPRLAACYRRAAAAAPIPITGTLLSRAACPAA